MRPLEILQPCTEMWGSCRLHPADPFVSQASDVVYLPFGSPSAWGIYHRDGSIVEASVDRHGPSGEIYNQPAAVELPALGGIPEAPDRYYIYGGTMSVHYGHFIINSLPRLWQRSRLIDRGAKVLFHGPGTPADWFDRPFVRDILAAVGIGPLNVAFFAEPTRIRNLVVPHPSFQEQSFVHRVFGTLGQTIGRVLAGVEPLHVNHRPVYLSKTALAGGVGRVVNEIEIENILRANGVEIAYPEKLTMREQVRLFGQRTCVIGITGSAFHTGFLFRPRGRVICVSPTAGPNSNFYLLDEAAGYRVEYFFPPGSTVAGQNSDGFLTSMEVQSPALVAADLLSIIETERRPGGPT